MILVVVVVGFVIWAVVRVVIDAKTWFKDEILDDYPAPAKNSGEPRLEERAVDDICSEDRRVEEVTSNDQQTRFLRRP